MALSCKITHLPLPSASPLTVHIAGGLSQRPVVQNEALLGAGGHVEPQVGRVAGGQTREPGVAGALEVDGETLAVGAREALRTLTSGGEASVIGVWMSGNGNRNYGFSAGKRKDYGHRSQLFFFIHYHLMNVACC